MALADDGCQDGINYLVYVVEDRAGRAVAGRIVENVLRVLGIQEAHVAKAGLYELYQGSLPFELLLQEQVVARLAELVALAAYQHYWQSLNVLRRVKGWRRRTVPLHVFIPVPGLAVLEVVVVHFELLRQHNLPIVIDLLERASGWKVPSVVVKCFFRAKVSMVLNDHLQGQGMSLRIQFRNGVELIEEWL